MDYIPRRLKVQDLLAQDQGPFLLVRGEEGKKEACISTKLLGDAETVGSRTRLCITRQVPGTLIQASLRSNFVPSVFPY
jgi:hypothetical protein